MINVSSPYFSTVLVAVFLISLVGMENLSEMFVFSAQQSLINSTSDESRKDLNISMHVDSGIGLETSCNAKRARAEHDVLGRHDVGTDFRKIEDMGSFKSKLMNMSTPSSWSGFGTGKEKLKIELDDIVNSEGPTGPMMKLSPKLKEQLQKPWANALNLKNMGRSHKLNFMLSKLSLKWSLIRHWQLTDLGDEFFVARFQMKEDLDYVLTKGPWVIANQYLTVQRWKPNFVPGEDIIQSMPIWVRLSKLPMEWMDSELLWNIGGMLGMMCKVDPIIENQARGRFA
ncbi:hypothetical protein Dsin_019739 [Dipteronia sinensis]|uniref:DUF4283 domain-containing protein n=1 Tax=Dipteronia sinensis TaxID=43782 RepID=A0AAE0E337_9ROSI|nr:hypothetical protein Dsin_019739 [Dipteronia sinensis]